MSIEDRIRATYAARDTRLGEEDWAHNIYHPRHPLGQRFVALNRESLVEALNHHEVALREAKVLDVGCGTGSWLRQLVDLGARPANLVGTDLSADRLAYAKESNPGIEWVLANGMRLPFEDAAFDLTLQILVFSSIPDDAARGELAAEMLRVTKSGGHIFWVDLKAANSPNLVTFKDDEVRAYFPGTAAGYSRPTHPHYLRRMYGRPAPLAMALYRLTRAWCESTFMVLTKSTSTDAVFL